MSRSALPGTAICLFALTFNALASPTDPPAPPSAEELSAARQMLPTGDGWASVSTPALPNGTTGGAAAAPERTVVVTNRNELVAALAFPDATPKLILVRGLIDANVDEAGQPLGCTDYHRPDPTTGELYSLETFLATFDPAGPWGRVNPSGPQERARAASAAAQQSRVRIRIPANTTIYGIGSEPTLRGAWFDIRPSSTSGNQPMNVIIRNLRFQDAVDCFTAWAPTDGATGNWNALYDSISVRNSTHVWIDHNAFADTHSFDASLPSYFGRLYQVHDGHVDITNESNYVTVSWNQFLLHDKTMLIGSSDGATADRDKLRVTLHHNRFDGVGQRVPRVRFGQVHVYNNLFVAAGESNYGYSWGVGIESQLYAENNHLDMESPFAAVDVIERFNGTHITDIGNCVSGKYGCVLTDIVTAWNASFDPDLTPDAGWTPTLYGPALMADPVETVRGRVLGEAGPFDSVRK